MRDGDIRIEPTPPGFLDRKQFENELTRAVRGIMKNNPQSLEEQAGRETIAEAVLCEMLAIDPESNLADISHLTDHMSGDKSGVIRDIMNRNHSREAVARMDSLHKEVKDFEETHRKEDIVPHVGKEEPPEA